MVKKLLMIKDDIEIFPYALAQEKHKKLIDMFPPTDSATNAVDMFLRMGILK